MPDLRALSHHPEEPPPDDGDPYAHTGPTRDVPHDNDAERSILGAMLRDPSAIDDVLALVTAHDFYRPQHEQIFDVALDLHGARHPVDPITVADELRKRGTLKRVGGAAYLHDLTASTPIVTNADYYAEIVHGHAVTRRIIEAGTQIVALGYAPGDSTADDLFAHALTTLTHARPTATSDAAHPWAPVDLAEILEHGDVEETPTVLERVDGFCLLYPGTVHSISGESESGKTWVALIGAAQELNAGAHVGMLDFEDRAGRVVTRLLQLGVKPDRILERFHYIRPLTRLDAAGRQHIEHIATRCSLVILDGVTEAMSLHGLDLNDQGDVAAFLLMLPRMLADLGPAVLQIDHLPKLTDPTNRHAIGAQHKLAGLDGAAYIVKVIETFGRGKKGRAVVTVAKDRPGAIREQTSGNTIAELVLDSTAPGHALRAALEVPRGVSKTDDGMFRPTILMERVSRYIEDNPGESGRQIEHSVQGKNTGIRDALKILALEGLVTGEPGARGSVHYTSVTPYREADDPT